MRIFFLLILLLISKGVNAQNLYTLVFLQDSYKQIKKNYEREFKDSLSLFSYVDKFKNEAIKKGFLLASVDSFFIKEKTVSVNLHIGEKFDKAHLAIDPENFEFLRSKMRISEKFFTDIPFRPEDIAEIMQKCLETYENNGFPFARLQIRDIKIIDNSLHGTLHIEPYKEYRWTEIHIKGDSSIFKTFVSGIIRIKKNDVYNQDELNNVSQRLAQINFIREIKPFEVLFTQNGCELYLYLESNPVSSINGIVGLQQNAATSKLTLTGDISLRLLNTLRRGELLNFNWRSIQEQTQSLDARLNFPFLFKTPFGIDGTFKLYKRDTSFLELKSSIGVQYFLKGGNYLKVFYANNSSNVLSGGAANPTFSNLKSVSSHNYGLSIFRQRLDYLPNPSKGFISQFTGSAGTRTSRTLDSNQIVKQTVFTGSLNLNWFIPISQRNVIMLGNHTETYYAPEIYENELSRFGGLNSQRGFNEEELFATTFSTFSLEYRFLLDRNSRVFAFFDQTLYENSAVNYFKDQPFGFGAGFSFGTNIGIFTISYALGKQFDNPVLLRNGKVHFGYIAYF